MSLEQPQEALHVTCTDTEVVKVINPIDEDE
jgi:hypothetical protein